MADYVVSIIPVTTCITCSLQMVTHPLCNSMDSSTLRCEMVWTQSGPPANPNHFLFLEQITSPDVSMNRSEIEQLSNRKISDDEVIKDLQWPQCTICWLTFKNGDDLLLMPNCAHYFHEGCLDTWLQVCQLTLCGSECFSPRLTLFLQNHTLCMSHKIIIFAKSKLKLTIICTNVFNAIFLYLMTVLSPSSQIMMFILYICLHCKYKEFR